MGEEVKDLDKYKMNEGEFRTKMAHYTNIVD